MLAGPPRARAPAARADRVAGAWCERSENLPAVGRRGDAQLVAVLRHRPASDLDALLVEQAGQGAVGQRPFRVFGLDELLDLALHRQRRDVFPVVAVDTAVE